MPTREMKASALLVSGSESCSSSCSESLLSRRCLPIHEHTCSTSMPAPRGDRAGNAQNPGTSGRSAARSGASRWRWRRCCGGERSRRRVIAAGRHMPPCVSAASLYLLRRSAPCCRSACPWPIAGSPLCGHPLACLPPGGLSWYRQPQPAGAPDRLGTQARPFPPWCRAISAPRPATSRSAPGTRRPSSPN